MRYVLVYGALAGGVVVAVIVAGIVFDASHLQSEWFGYLIMLLALSLIFVGIKRYRDIEQGGVIRFGRALAVGLGISVIAGTVYVAGWEVYTAISPRDFIADYSASIIKGMQASGASAAEIARQKRELAELAVNYRNPLFRMPMTFLEIFPVGVLVSLVAAALLRNPRFLPARAPA